MTNKRRVLTLKVKLVLGIIAILALLTGSSAPFLVSMTPVAAQTENPYLVRTFVDEDGNQIDEVIVPGRPPEIKAAVVAVPEPHIEMGINILTEVPAFDWSYGCSATSAAMLFGYYDRTGYSNMYTGITNGGVCPLDNSIWGPGIGGSDGECPLSATHQGKDGRTTRGHVDDYWIDYLDPGPDPWIVNGWTEHTHGDCTGDFMGTNQSAFGNTDGATLFYYYTEGAPLYDYTDCEPDNRDGCHGMRLFAESRGYSVITNFTQLIYGYNGNTLGFTFDQYTDEIDAGRPVLIGIEGHTMLGWGYDTTDNIVYIHDTWDHSDHQMTWGGSYDGFIHKGVTVIQLAAAVPLSVTTNNASSITDSSATLNGNLNNPGTASTVYVSFEYGLTTAYGYGTPPQEMTTTGPFSFPLTGLLPNTTYHVRAKAVGDGTSYGWDKSFTTSGVGAAPSVTTNDATNITTSSATLNGNLDNPGTASTVYVSFEYGLTTAYGSVTTPQPMTTTGPFNFPLTGLLPNTTYHVRAKAVGDGTSHGLDKSFTTSGVGAVEVSIDAPAEVAPNSDFTADVVISQVDNFDAASYNISVDDSILRLDNVTSGQLDTTVIPVDIWNEINPGTYTIIQNVPGLAGVDGLGTLAVLHFHVVGTECQTSEINLSNGILGNNLAQQIPATWVGDSVHVSTSGVLPGDANGDGVVNNLDITKVERIIVGLDTETPGADANQDGVVNNLDITKVERIIVGLD